MKIASTMYFRPPMRTAWLLMPDFDKAEFFLQLRIAHDFVPQRSGPGRDYLNHCLHSRLASAGNQFFCNPCFARSGDLEVAPPWFGSRNQPAIHHVNVDVFVFRMAKSTGQTADDLETEVLPKTDRGHVRGNHKIELHRAKTEPARFAQAMLGHCATDPLPARICQNHERCVCDV